MAPVPVYTAVSLVWTAPAMRAFARGLAVAACGCYGTYLSQQLSWFTLLQGALTPLHPVVLLRGTRRNRRCARTWTAGGAQQP